MSLNEQANEPIEITLGGRKLKIQRLSISELFIPAQTKITNDFIANINKMAETKVGKDKNDFEDRMFDKIPTGKELDSLALEYMETPVGVAQVLMIGLNKGQAITELEVSDLISNATESELNFIRDYMSGDSEAKKKLRMVEPKPEVPEPAKV
jgi:hypothetical protein